MKHILTLLLVLCGLQSQAQNISTPPVTFTVRYNANGSLDTIKNYWTDRVIMQYVADHGGSGSQTLQQTTALGNTTTYPINIGTVNDYGSGPFQSISLYMVDSNGNIQAESTDGNSDFLAWTGIGNAGWQINAPGTSITADGVNGMVLSNTLLINILSSTNISATNISAGNMSLQNNDASIYTQIVTSDDGTQNFIEMGNALGFFDITLDPTGTTLNMPYPSYANDAAAGIGGLVTGSLYQITGTGIVHIKQ